MRERWIRVLIILKERREEESRTKESRGEEKGKERRGEEKGEEEKPLTLLPGWRTGFLTPPHLLFFQTGVSHCGTITVKF